MERRDASEHYRYADGRLLAMRREVRGEPPLVLEYAHDEQGRRAAKYVNGQLAEMYEWADALRLARVRTGRADMEFGYRENARIPFAMSLNGRTLYLFYDQVGSPRVVADERGNVVQEIRYDSFGRVVESVGALTDAGITLPIGFAGGLYDPDLGQCGYVRFGLRDYDPFPGRFTAKDPLGYAAGDSDLYGYCLDDPVNAVDPTGLKTKVHLYEGVPVDHISVEVGNGPAIGKYPNDNSDIFGGQGKFKTEDRIPDHTIEIETTKEQEEYMKGYQSKAQKALQYITTCLTTIV